LVTVRGDVADPNTANLVFKEALDCFGRVDTLVNNAGIFIGKPFTSYSNDDYANYIATNVTGFFHVTQRAMQLMSQAGRGHIVTVTSSLVDQPMSSVPGVLTSLTKGALNAATRALAIEHAGRMSSRRNVRLRENFPSVSISQRSRSPFGAVSAFVPCAGLLIFEPLTQLQRQCPKAQPALSINCYCQGVQ
jgi:NADP-dependent 3-hydroxy acid dehydrogenase YdfG